MKNRTAYLTHFDLTKSHMIYINQYRHPPENIKYAILKQSFIEKKISLLSCGEFYFKRSKSLFHSLGYFLSTNNDWIVSLEHYFIFSDNNFNRLWDPNFRNKLIKIFSKKNCKKILGLTKKAASEIDNYLEHKCHSKIDFCYPSIEPNIKQIDKNKLKHKCELLFICNWDFIGKGGREVIESFLILRKKYGNYIKLTMKVGETNKYIEKIKHMQNVSIINSQISPEKIRDLYLTADIFVFPLYKSSFGVFLEALSFGLPIVSSKVFDIEEIIQHNVNGFLVNCRGSLFDKFIYKIDNYGEYEEFLLKDGTDENMVKEIVYYVDFLINNRDKYFEISTNNLNTVKCGRFSIAHMNEKLKNIYEESLKKNETWL
jgi:glycosyltransferase involved in cell wall biosynthesis